MLVLRSLLFNFAFYLNLTVWLVAIVPAYALPGRFTVRLAQAWSRSSLWLLRVIAGTRVEIRGREHIPDGGVLVAAKHQSFLETFALYATFENPTFILKRELMWIPLWGWSAWKTGMVAIDRRAGSQALAAMNERARQEAARGRQICIFPEGTRRPPGAAPAYKYGAAHLYAALGVPCLPVGVNTGLYWPRRGFLRRPGTAVIEICDPVPAGLDREIAFAMIKERIEASSERLLREGKRELGLDELAPYPTRAEQSS
jgi:1-acyl-sn-glycerol-3-phosphate acyltransferase